MQRIHLEAVDSTNAYARVLASNGGGHGTLVTTERQTNGRGRLGRVWQDGGYGNCMASVILRPNLSPNMAPMLCLAAAVAIQKSCGEQVGVKWPNDLLTRDGRKVGGILAEMEIDAGALEFVVIGFGVNLVRAPAEVEHAAALCEFGVEIEPQRFAAECASRLVNWCRTLERDSTTLISAWNAVDVTVGRRVTVGKVRGRAIGIRVDGALVVDGDDGARHVIRAGDVEMVAEV